MQIKKKEIEERILESAKQLFLEKSYSNVSLKMIAKQAGLSRGALYTYFVNKEDIFFSLTKPAVELIQDNYSPKKVDGVSVFNHFMSREKMIQSFMNHANGILENKESFELLFFKAGGSTLENYRVEVINIYTHGFIKWRESFPQPNRLDGRSGEMIIHSLASSYVSFIEQVIIHSPQKVELRNYVHDMAIMLQAVIKSLVVDESKDVEKRGRHEQEKRKTRVNLYEIESVFRK